MREQARVNSDERMGVARLWFYRTASAAQQDPAHNSAHESIYQHIAVLYLVIQWRVDLGVQPSTRVG